jgi:FtsH-binding integral membrane protein
MADFRQNQMDQTVGRAGVEYDAGLRSYMLGVYNYMALGIAGTAIAVLAIASSPTALATVFSLRWVFLIGMIAVGWFGPKFIMNSRSPAMAHGAFALYAGLWAAAITPMVGYYLSVQPNLVGQAFGVTAVMFGGMSILGYTTKKNLSGIGQFAAMAIIGIFVAALVNIFFVGSIGFSMFVSAAFVLLIAAITAWETQMIKNMYSAGDAVGVASRKSIFGAFMLYGSFVSMFINLLQLMGFMSSE